MGEDVSWGSFSSRKMLEVVRGAVVVELLELLSSDLAVSVAVNLVEDIVELGLSGNFNSEIVAGRPDVLSVKVSLVVGVVSVEGAVAACIIVAWLVDSGDSVGSVVAVLGCDSASKEVGVGGLELVVLGDDGPVLDVVDGVLGEDLARAVEVRRGVGWLVVGNGWLVVNT